MKKMLCVNNEAFISILSLYKRTEKSFEEDVTTIANWMTTQPHLPEIMDRARISNFLLMNKCSVEKTKEKIDNYYTLRKLVPEFYPNLYSEEIKKSMEIAYWVLLPKLTKNLHRVHLMKMRKPELIDVLEPLPYCARGLFLQEIRLKEDHMFKDVIIMDMEGMNWGYLLKLTIPLFIKVITIYEKVYSNRLEAIYVINSVPGLHKLVDMVKNVLKPKLLDRIHIHPDSKILSQIFPKEMLPLDYGGEEKSVEELNEILDKKLCDYQCYFQELYSMRVNEALRPVLKNDEFFGFHGNFKKLSID